MLTLSEEISSTIKLADFFYENSFYSIKEIPIGFRFSILVARRIYRKIGHKIIMDIFSRTLPKSLEEALVWLAF